MSDAAAILQRLRQLQTPPPISVKLWLHPIGYVPPKKDYLPLLMKLYLVSMLLVLALS